MSTFPDETPTQVCERFLQNERRYNIEHRILRSEVTVIDRLLNRRLEMTPAYEDLHDKLSHCPEALHAFLGLVLSTAAFWSPEKIVQARAWRDELAEVNREIASKAADLALLLGRRTTLHNTSGFSSDTHYHVVDLIEAASGENHLFNFHLKEPLDAVRAQYDLKYWPSLSKLVAAMAADAVAAAEAHPEASDPLTTAATAARRPSPADFFKALFAAIDENGLRNHGKLPDDFKASDNVLASVVNCSLDLDPDDMVSAPYVKRLRQRVRETQTRR